MNKKAMEIETFKNVEKRISFPLRYFRAAIGGVLLYGFFCLIFVPRGGQNFFIVFSPQLIFTLMNAVSRTKYHIVNILVLKKRLIGIVFKYNSIVEFDEPIANVVINTEKLFPAGYNHFRLEIKLSNGLRIRQYEWLGWDSKKMQLLESAVRDI